MKKKTVDAGLPLWDNYPIMANKQTSPITDILRQSIIASKMPLLTLEQETGVQRGSIGRFIRGERSLRLDLADKLAAYFGLTLQPDKAKKKGK